MFPQKPKTKKEIFLDHASTTPVRKEALVAMQPYFSNVYGNPSSLHKAGVKAREAVEKARKNIAIHLAAQPDTILFTSGGTEANNLAILGVARKHKKYGKHIITTKIEHAAVLEPMKRLEKEGFDVSYLNVDEHGFVSVEDFKKALREETILVSIMFANNEIGSMEPIAEMGKEILKWRKIKKTMYPYFHTDACQAAGVVDLNVERSHVDLMTLNSSKIYGPKGVGCLYKRRGVHLEPLMYGGNHEFGLRPGTENVSGIVGFATAFDLAQKEREKENKRLRALRASFFKILSKKVDGILVNGSLLEDERRLPNNLHLSIRGVEGEQLMLYLDAYGIYCSVGSACSSESNEVSHVLRACGYDDERIRSSVRFSFGKANKKEDVEYVMKYLPGIIDELREMIEIKKLGN